MSAIVTYSNPYAEDIYGRVPRMLSLFTKQAGTEDTPTVQPSTFGADWKPWQSWGANRIVNQNQNFIHPSQRGQDARILGAHIQSNVVPGLAADFSRNRAAASVGGSSTWEQLRFGFSTILGKVWDWVQSRLPENQRRPNPFTFQARKGRDIKRQVLQDAGVDTSSLNDFQLDLIDHTKPESIPQTLNAIGLEDQLKTVGKDQAALLPLAGQYYRDVHYGGDQEFFDESISSIPSEDYYRSLAITAQSPEFRQWTDTTNPTKKPLWSRMLDHPVLGAVNMLPGVNIPQPSDVLPANQLRNQQREALSKPALELDSGKGVVSTIYGKPMRSTIPRPTTTGIVPVELKPSAPSGTTSSGAGNNT